MLENRLGVGQWIAKNEDTLTELVTRMFYAKGLDAAIQFFYDNTSLILDPMIENVVNKYSSHIPYWTNIILRYGIEVRKIKPAEPSQSAKASDLIEKPIPKSKELYEKRAYGYDKNGNRLLAKKLTVSFKYDKPVIYMFSSKTGRRITPSESIKKQVLSK